MCGGGCGDGQIFKRSGVEGLELSWRMMKCVVEEWRFWALGFEILRCIGSRLGMKDCKELECFIENVFLNLIWSKGEYFR